ncbi:esterase [Solihabitans fulvus]|uniref:Esterase n=1 Tax=Solihabitans fulvus TaxID=1892852 RepID=A0A5B2WRI8_9PSEU|nr:alpha/beta hydrolase-fold protein [Solihabitans fulvus]KAA2254115.1 esterase [Solihabitans fulvus]
MGPASEAFLIVTVAVAVAAVVFAAWSWDRFRRARVPWRLLVLLLCVVTAAAGALAGVNRELSVYTSWAQVFGGQDTDADQAADLPTDGGSQLTQFTASGSGVSQSVTVYLPPGYGRSASAGVRYPMILTFAGFPGSPQTWLTAVGLQQHLDREIAERRMAPTVVVLPVQNAAPDKDSECVDAVGGARFDTYLSTDVPIEVAKRFRVRADRQGRGMLGYSTGGFCAANLLLRHPDRFAAAASIAGYLSPITDNDTGDLYRGDPQARKENDPLWRIANKPVPPVALYLATALDDADLPAQIQQFAQRSKPPLELTSRTVPTGGHSVAAWQTFVPPALDWLSARLAGPVRS